MEAVQSTDDEQPAGWKMAADIQDLNCARMPLAALPPPLFERIDPPRKIAIVHARRIGDFVCATPAYRAYRLTFPEAEISLIGLPWIEPLVERSPHLDRFIEYPGYPGVAQQYFEPHWAVRFFQQMQGERFDLAIQTHGSGVYSNPFTLMLGARHTAGFVRSEDPDTLLDASLAWDERAHETARMVALAQYLGAAVNDAYTDFPLLAHDEVEGERLLHGLVPPLIGLHCGAREPTKRWLPDRFATTAKTLAQQLRGSVVVLGASDDIDLADRVCAEIGSACANLAGRMTLPVLGAVIKRLGLLVTNDSGPAHIAYALGTPTVTIFGATDPVEWGPGSSNHHQAIVNRLSCWPCKRQTCDIGYACLEGIMTKQVLDACRRALDLKQNG